MKTIIFSIVVLSFLPFLAASNGGDQRVLGADFLINLSKSPFTPVAGSKTAMTVSFVDLKTRAPIKEDILVHVYISKGRGGGTVIYEQKNVLVKGGVLDLSYTFSEPGLHELFFDFAYASAPDKVYAPPDFLIDIQPTLQTRDVSSEILLSGIAVIVALFTGFILGRKSRSK